MNHQVRVPLDNYKKVYAQIGLWIAASLNGITDASLNNIRRKIKNLSTMASVEKSKREMMKVLPEQIISYEILTRVPTKSLVRCKSVCKSWLSLLSDPKFTKLHCEIRAQQNPDDYDCLVASKYTTGLVSVSRHEQTCILPPDRFNLMKLIGSIHGLVCLRRDHEDKLWLWNPAIRRAKEFWSPSLQRQGGRIYCWNNFGFGFDHVRNDYKVVVFSDSVDRMWSAFLYSSNSDTWSHLIVPEHVIEQAKLKQILSYCPTTTIVKDCPYWTSYNPSGHRLNFLKFDTRTNKFEFLPEFQSKSGRDTILVNMMDRPALMDYEQNFQNISVDVCSLDEDSGVWRKMYSVGPIANCGLKWDLTQGFKYGGSIVFYSDGVFSYYDHKTDTMCLVPGPI
ncbi:F-box/kelch-repeat protein At3g23880-like [Daucus carota subsp. sativus]|uniref:F-box/kelch-repeat protein At3g23880-like n=1 Tax=Daucus carota subsp. sativus TaxID=79200 RepID=UPI0007EF9059|nr:PREDICTED: F-box/kelch-repeat protein At3g23880-like [Daucus carota subsp. sativus]